MSRASNDKPTDEPVIRFAGKWVPAHDLWCKMEMAHAVADVIERFNQHFPRLASTGTREVVPLVRQRLKDIQLRIPDRPTPPDLAGVASDLLGRLSPEAVIAVLRENHATTLDMVGLIELAGEAPYLQALRREGVDSTMNQVAPAQTAEAWNRVGRPAPGGGLWTEKKVSCLLA